MVADPTGGGWILENASDGEAMALGRIGADGSLVRVGALPWMAGSFLGLEDGRLAVGVVRCEPIDECATTVSELIIIEATGQVSSSTLVSRRDGGGPDESDAVRLVGEVGSSIWVHTFDPQFVRVSANGDVAEEVRARGAPCIVSGEFHTLTVVEGEQTAEVSPTSDPAHPDRYTVRRAAHGALVSVEGGTVDAPSNSIGECIGDAFETYATRDQPSNYWTLDDGWTTQRRGPEPEQPRSNHAFGSGHHEFVVDGTGTLLIRVTGQWTPTPIRFDTPTSRNEPPRQLLADRSHDALVACLTQPGGTTSERSVPECQTATLR